MKWGGVSEWKRETVSQLVSQSELKVVIEKMTPAELVATKVNAPGIMLQLVGLHIHQTVCCPRNLLPKKHKTHACVTA